MDCASEIIFLMDAIAHFYCELAGLGQRPSLNLESLYYRQAVRIGNPWDDINGRIPHPTLTVAQKRITSLASSGPTILPNHPAQRRTSRRCLSSSPTFTSDGDVTSRVWKWRSSCSRRRSSGSRAQAFRSSKRYKHACRMAPGSSGSSHSTPSLRPDKPVWRLSSKVSLNWWKSLWIPIWEEL